VNEYLAELYGTADVADGEDHLEKAASVVLLEKIAEEQGVDLSDIDLDDLNEEELSELITEAIGEETAEEAGAELAEAGEIVETGETVEDAEKEAMAKMAEADFLGRTMAHAYANELQSMQQGELEKEAGGKEKILALLQAAKARATSVGKSRKAAYGRARSKGREAVSGRTAGIGSRGIPDKMSKKERLMAALGAAKEVAPEAALGGGAAYGASKLSSALDTLAVQRAEEWLGKLAESEEENSTEDQLEEAVDQRALEMLIEGGYIDPSELE
jgi:hypothetical protein